VNKRKTPKPPQHPLALQFINAIGAALFTGNKIGAFRGPTPARIKGRKGVYGAGLTAVFSRRQRDRMEREHSTKVNG